MDTRPPVFSKAEEPLEANDWIRTIEQKFDLINCVMFKNLCLQLNNLGVLQVPGGQTILQFR
jgi:hypothetical protein